MDNDILLPSEKRAAAQEAQQPSSDQEELMLPSETRGKTILPKVGGIESAVRGAGQMALLGYNPQVVAGAKSLFGANYEQELKKQKARQEAAWEQHPVAYGAGAATTVLPAAAEAILAPEIAGPAIGLRAAQALRPFTSVAELGATGLEAAAAARPVAGIAQPALQGTAKILRSPVVQGAIYGSAEGDTAVEKAKSAAMGAVGAKVGEKVLPIIPKAVVGTAGWASNKLMKALSANPTEAQKIAALADEIGVSIPKAVGEPGVVSGFAQKLDPLGQINAASAQTVGQVYGRLSDIHGDVLPEDAGAAVNNAFKNWLSAHPNDNPNGFRAALEKIYSPPEIKDLSRYAINVPMESLMSELKKIRMTKGRLTDVEPSLGVVRRALEHPEGLTFDEMRDLRQIISDQIDFNKLPGSSNLDEEILRNLRKAVSKDMEIFAETVGGKNAVNVFRNAEKQASEMYKVRSYLTDKLAYDPTGAASTSSLFNNLAKMARVKTGDARALDEIKSTIDPQTWDKFSQGMLRAILPEGRFSLSAFNKNWNSISPEAKEIIFGSTGSGVRAQLENISKFGEMVGPKLDKFAARAPEVQDIASGVPVQTAVLEASMTGGLPLKSLATMAGMVRAGKTGAQDIAAAMPPPSETQRMLQFVKTNLQSMPAWNDFVQKVADPTFRTTATGAKILNESAKQVGMMLSAQTGAQLTPDQVEALALGTLYAGKKAGQQFGFFQGEERGESTGGRIGRASGGRVHNVDSLVDELMGKFRKAKKETDKTTESLLNAPDEHIVKALDVAQQAI